MEQTEKALSPQESLRVIRNTIDLAKRSFRDNGFHFLLWGWLVVLASAAHWYLLVNRLHPNPEIAWAVMVVIGMPAALIREWRRGKQIQAPNLFHQMYGMIWLGYGISMGLAIPLAAKSGFSPVPIILVLTGFATFMSGIILSFKPLVFGAAAIWAGALWCLFLSPEQHLLVQAASAVFGYLLPGYLLNHQMRESNVPRP
ncbi:MAG: hypothetical protein IPH31_23240 [Lewinellaceae bacterium]|nr:hypothetical protein [Lewinellaceae bacterium]